MPKLDILAPKLDILAPRWRIPERAGGEVGLELVAAAAPHVSVFVLLY